MAGSVDLVADECVGLATVVGCSGDDWNERLVVRLARWCCGGHDRDDRLVIGLDGWDCWCGRGGYGWCGGIIVGLGRWGANIAVYEVSELPKYGWWYLRSLSYRVWWSAAPMTLSLTLVVVDLVPSGVTYC